VKGRLGRQDELGEQPLHYQRVNQGIAALLGGLHSAECALYSVDFAEIEATQFTMHKVYDDVSRLGPSPCSTSGTLPPPQFNFAKRSARRGLRSSMSTSTNVGW
jgi:hypothetical protein